VIIACWTMGSIRRRVEKTTIPSIDELGVRWARVRRPGFEVSVIVWCELVSLAERLQAKVQSGASEDLGLG